MSLKSAQPETQNKKRETSANLTRRQLAVALAAPGLLGQTQAVGQGSDEELKAVRDQNRQIGDQLARFPLPMSIEPATHFKA